MFRVLFRQSRCTKMASEVVNRLQTRADEADQIIKTLRDQLNLMKNTAAVEACKVEEEKLKTENQKLKQEVSKLKKELVQVETANGVKQVSLPKSGSAPAAAIEQEPPKEQKKVAEKPKDGQDKPQQAKKEKKKGEAKPKPPPADAAPIDASRMDMRIGFIVSAKKHPDADGLYVEEVDVGEEKPRTIISGLVKHIPLEDMQQRYAIFLLNLKPAKMRGIFSHGMIMCGSTPEKVEIVIPPEGVTPGEKVIVDGYTGTPDLPQMNPKKKIFEQIQPDLGINAEGLAHYKGALWRVDGKGTCRVPTMRDTPVK